MQPEDVLPGDIDANLGAPWIPDADIQAISPPSCSASPPSSIQIGHLKKDAVWSVEAGYQAEQSVAATAEYGTPQGQRRLAARAGPQPEDAGHLRHDP